MYNLFCGNEKFMCFHSLKWKFQSELLGGGGKAPLGPLVSATSGTGTCILKKVYPGLAKRVFFIYWLLCVSYLTDVPVLRFQTYANNMTLWNLFVRGNQEKYCFVCATILLNQSKSQPNCICKSMFAILWCLRQGDLKLRRGFMCCMPRESRHKTLFHLSQNRLASSQRVRASD